MEVLVGDAREELLQGVPPRHGLDDELTLFDEQIDLAVALQPELLREWSRNSYRKAVSPLLNLGAHRREPSVRIDNEGTTHGVWIRPATFTVGKGPQLDGLKMYSRFI